VAEDAVIVEALLVALLVEPEVVAVVEVAEQVAVVIEEVVVAIEEVAVLPEAVVVVIRHRLPGIMKKKFP